MGRPPIGQRAMTPAERKRRERQLLRGAIVGELRIAREAILKNQQGDAIDALERIADLIAPQRPRT